MSSDTSESKDSVEKTPSEEVDQHQLDLAKQEGDAYQKSVEYMATEVANTGDMKHTGDYIVGFAQEKAEGMWEWTGEGEFEWREPTSENCHIEVVVADAADGRFVPYVDVQVTLAGENGEEIGPMDVPFLWHPGLHHYGKNIELPGDGTYTLRIEAKPPQFKRHDKQNGNRYGETVTVEFENVDITTGQG